MKYVLMSEENETHDIDTITNSNANLSNDNDSETIETNQNTSVEVIGLRNYDTQSTATIEVINFEDLKLSINELITTDLATQSKLDELILQQQYSNTLSMYSIIGLASLLIVMIFYKLLIIGFSRY